ncbi:MAG TPA: penicillin-binding protein [Acidisarcina sp.]
MLGFFCLWGSVICMRLVWLQVVRHQEFLDRAARQQQRTFEVAPRRGVLYDRNLHELAMTVLVDSVYAVPIEISNKAATAEALARVVHVDPAESFTTSTRILARMTASKDFAWVARKQDPSMIERIKALNLKGIYFQKEFKRYYPNNDIAAQVLGYVGTDDNGLGGLEQQFDDELHGTPGHMLTALDAKRHVLGSEESEPLPGENLVLNIDQNIQYIAERALDEQMARMKALHGTVVVQDPHTGQILALAISPRFNPNDSRHMDAGVLTNLAVSDVYEPGSTFKLVAYAAALDAAGVQPTDKVDCQGGSMTMFGRTLHDDKSDHYGVITVKQALEHSSDVAAAKMALKLGPAKFYGYMRDFGFGQRSGIELPSETRGLLQSPKRWGATSILSMAIGQEVGVTPVQLVGMVSTIANGGVYMPPHILLQSTGEMKGDARLQPAAFHPENELPEQLPDGAHRVIKELTAAQMRMMMQGIVLEGTGKLAQLNGYSSAGKTGTAQKVDPETHTYSHTKLVASFAGFAPVSSPAISVAVVIDQPTAGSAISHYGGATSAPVFAEVAQQVLEYLGVPHDMDLKLAPKAATAAIPREEPSEHTGDLNALFADLNELPADDPLRKPPATAPLTPNPNAEASGRAVDDPSRPEQTTVSDRTAASSINASAHQGSSGSDSNGPGFSGPAGAGRGGVAAASLKQSTAPAVSGSAAASSERLSADAVTSRPAEGGPAVVLDARKRVPVPSLIGDSVRKAIEEAGLSGLTLEAIGNGIAAEQAPAPGTMVPTGTEVVVRFKR